MKFVVATAALLLVSGFSHADPQHIPFQQKKAQTRDNGKPHPFNVRDLVILDRVSDPQFSPDGKHVAFQVRETDYADNKGVTSIWLLDLSDRAPAPEKIASTFVASSPRWSPDGKEIYFLAKPKGGKTTGVYRFHLDDNEKQTPEALTPYKVDVDNFKLSPDGKKLLLSIDVEPDCAANLCMDKPLDTAALKTTGKLYDKLFVRHWDTWSDGKRSALFITDVNPEAAKASMVPAPKLLTKGIDGDVPSKPFGDESEYAFSPDGKTVYFDVRIAGRTEPWST
ncbi:MAG TPA: S9 family peptidase, partial [Rudaea sp.]|nr:S9 family peptidase [Rudaea sp.]